MIVTSEYIEDLLSTIRNLWSKHIEEINDEIGKSPTQSGSVTVAVRINGQDKETKVAITLERQSIKDSTTFHMEDENQMPLFGDVEDPDAPEVVGTKVSIMAHPDADEDELKPIDAPIVKMDADEINEDEGFS